jgi:protein phosphatase
LNYNYLKLSKIGFKRFTNEDAIGVFETPEGLLAIVADGLGGNRAGEVASQMCVESIHNHFTSLTASNYLERIKIAITKANATIIEAASGNPHLNGMATTADVLFLNGINAYWGHVGDSRIYSFSDKKLSQITKDHSLIQRLVDDGYLTIQEAETYPNKQIITRAVGDSNSLEIDLSKIKLPMDSKGVPVDDCKFFMCTDGVSGIVNNSELQSLLKQNILNIISEKLSKLIEERGAPDNYSFIIIACTK